MTVVSLVTGRLAVAVTVTVPNVPLAWVLPPSTRFVSAEGADSSMVRASKPTSTVNRMLASRGLVCSRISTPDGGIALAVIVMSAVPVASAVTVTSPPLTDADATSASVVEAEYKTLTPSAASKSASPMTSIASPRVNLLSAPNASFLAAVIASATSISVLAQTSLPRAVASFDASPGPASFTARTLKA